MKKTVRLIPLFLAVLLILSLTACANDPTALSPELQAASEKSDDFWVCGKNTSVRVTVAEFPLAFPELYRNIEFDPDDPKQCAINKTITGTSGDLYYEAEIRVYEDKKIPYTDATVIGFEMYGGLPGHMDVWNVTFGQTPEEVETAIREYFDYDSLFGEDIDVTGNKPYDGFDLSEEKISAMRAGTVSNVDPVQYAFANGVLIVSFVDDAVCGMAFYAGPGNPF